MNNKLLKLAKMVLNLAQVETKEGKTLISDGALEVGKEVFVEDENGDLVKPEDGEYNTDTQVIVVVDGLVTEIRDIENPENQDPDPENLEDPENQDPQPDEKDARIAELEAHVAELEAAISEKDARIAELEAELEAKNAANEELKSQLEKSDVKPAEEQLKSQKNENKSWFKPRF